MTLSEELTWRGFVNQTTLHDISALDQGSVPFYLGVDPSAKSMHIGQLAILMMIRLFVEHGHRPTLLVGGATGLIGDPDGKAQERDLKTHEEVGANKDGIVAQYRRLLGKDIDVVDNYDWFKSVGYLDFLREVGKHFSMTQLLDRDFVQSRIGEGGAGISYAEFSYSLIQGYDFLHLYRQKGVTLQIAGADQWGNSLSGVQLIRKLENAEAHIWTAPLVINKSTGKKFGKSEGGAVWLDAEMTSPYDFYQFWLNVDDEGVIDYLKLFTKLDKAQIDEIADLHAKNPGERLAQKTLARHTTAFVHGEETCARVEKVIRVLFGGLSVAELDAQDIELLATQIPAVSAETAVQALVESNVCESNGEVRRLIKNNAISVNGEKITDDCELERPSLVKKGKNAFVLVR